MFKIGDFSRIGQVTIQALRHYDEIGLLKPNDIDTNTGYRYYSLESLPRLNRILALKSLGLSLEDIKSILESDVSFHELNAKLEMKLQELRQQQQDTEAQIIRVRTRLNWIEKEHEMSNKEVVIKSTDTIFVLSIRQQVLTWEDIPGFFEEITNAVSEHEIVSTGAWIAIYHDTQWVANNIDIEIAIPIKKHNETNLPTVFGQPMQTTYLPQNDTIASILHHGPYDSKGESMILLGHWIEANNYQFSGAVREIYLRGPLDTIDPSMYLTELQIPITRSMNS